MKCLKVLIVSIFIFVSCNAGPGGISGNATLNDGEVWPIIESVLAEGAEISDERPDVSIASEKEILIKIAKVAAQDGYLDLDHPL
jgi:hypothetical protein